jgi:hypothetical protein
MNIVPKSLVLSTLLGAMVVSCLVVLPAVGQERIPEQLGSPRRITGALTPNCNGGIVNDNGTFETNFRFTAGTQPAPTDAVMRFTGPGPGRRIDQVCVCWFREAGASSTLNHELLVFRADGPGGEPGDLVMVADVTINGLPAGAQQMVSFDLTPFNVTTPGTSFFVGVGWSAGVQFGPGHYLCADTNNPVVHPTFVADSATDDWTNIRSFFSSIDAIGVRTELQATGGGGGTCAIGTCVENATTMCLAGGRFQVTSRFDPPNDADALLDPAQAIRLTGDTGYFWFFDPNNVEVVIKVLNACPVNDRFWVFQGGLTNVNTQVTVCDTQTGVQKQYSNPQSTPFQPIQDTNAFATCP